MTLKCISELTQSGKCAVYRVTCSNLEEQEEAKREALHNTNIPGATASLHTLFEEFERGTYLVIVRKP